MDYETLDRAIVTNTLTKLTQYSKVTITFDILKYDRINRCF